MSSIFRLTTSYSKKSCLKLRVSFTSSRGPLSSLGSSSPWRCWMQPLMPGIIGSPLRIFYLKSPTRHQTSPSAFMPFYWEVDIDLSDTGSFRSAYSRISAPETPSLWRLLLRRLCHYECPFSLWSCCQLKLRTHPNIVTQSQPMSWPGVLRSRSEISTPMVTTRHDNN